MLVIPRSDATRNLQFDHARDALGRTAEGGRPHVGIANNNELTTEA